MRRPATLAALVALAALGLPAAAPAQEADPEAEPAPAAPVPDDIRAVVVFNPLSFGEPTYVNGILRGVDQAGQKISLEESPFPFGAWTEVAATTTDPGGYFSFKRRPSLVTRWRAISRTANSSISAEVQADVAPRLRFKASLRGRRAAYRGSLAPAHHGAGVQIQRRSGRRWTTVATARLHRTAFRGRLRVRRRTIIRAFFPADGDHIAASSRPVTLDPR